ncbi:MAG: hypothetical protein GYB35_17305 [Algicola sp.]|nr:hypothetical protein [Algicola sp.]
MKINFSKIIFLSIVILFSLTNSCKKEKNVKPERLKRDRILQDSLYRREWLEIDYGNDRIERIEVYISKSGDTITNQYKPFKNHQIDTLRSEFYDLEISKTNKENIYKGKITIHSMYDKLELNEKNRKTLDFHYVEQNEDSIRITSKKSKSSDTIEFEYENAYGNHLQGIIIQTVERDTIIKNEEMVNLFMLDLLVDNIIITDNMCLEIYEFKKNRPYNLEKLKIEFE